VQQTTRLSTSITAATRQYRALHFEQHARNTDFLPPAFELIPRLLVLLDDPETNSDMLAEIIRSDAGLTTDILRAANTAALAGACRTESLPQAIIRLGLRDIYRLITTIITSPGIMNLDAFGFQRVDLWQHSVACGIAAQIMARNFADQDPEIAYTAALLHDIGKLVMAQVAKADYMTVLDACEPANRPHFRAEQQAYQTDHAVIGSMLLKRWRFPENIVAAVKFHHDPLNAPDDARRLACLILAGNIIAYRLNLGSGFPDYVVHPDPALLEPLNLQPSDLADYENEVQTTFRREQQRLWINK
jgi:putative nucleotidyltransferase with HDIG domain